MKKLLIGIFAHPDDEAFGPSGTLLKLRKEGYDIHLILLTDGEGGTNPDNEPDLGAVRLQEWQQAATLLGASSTSALHYPDGSLEKIATDEIDYTVAGIVSETLMAYGDPTALSFMTFEPAGLTGHRDHITASEVTTRLAARFNARDIWYFCLDSNQAPLEGTAYYEPRAREDSYITTRIDISPWREAKYRIMDTHLSQRSDAEAMKKLGGETECFHIETVEKA